MNIAKGHNDDYHKWYVCSQYCFLPYLLVNIFWPQKLIRGTEKRFVDNGSILHILQQNSMEHRFVTEGNQSSYWSAGNLVQPFLNLWLTELMDWQECTF